MITRPTPSRSVLDRLLTDSAKPAMRHRASRQSKPPTIRIAGIGFIGAVLFGLYSLPRGESPPVQSSLSVASTTVDTPQTVTASSTISANEIRFRINDTDSQLLVGRFTCHKRSVAISYRADSGEVFLFNGLDGTKSVKGIYVDEADTNGKLVLNGQSSNCDYAAIVSKDGRTHPIKVGK